MVYGHQSGLRMAPTMPQMQSYGFGGILLFDSWAWRNRKWIVLGGVGVLGAAVLAGLTAVLR